MNRWVHGCGTAALGGVVLLVINPAGGGWATTDAINRGANLAWFENPQSAIRNPQFEIFTQSLHLHPIIRPFDINGHGRGHHHACAGMNAFAFDDIALDVHAFDMVQPDHRRGFDI